MTDTLELRYDRGRAGRQLIGFGGCTLLMIGVAVLGGMLIVAAFTQPELALKILGGGFGLFFPMLGLASLVAAAVLITDVVRWSRQSEPLVIFDERGIGGLTVWRGIASLGQPHVAWGEIESMRLDSRPPKARRTNSLAELDPRFRLRLAVKGGLDRWVGIPLGIRDGNRSIRLVLVDGRIAGRDLTLPLGPASFGAVARRIVDHSRAHEVDAILGGLLAP